MNLLRPLARVCTGALYVYAGTKTAKKPAGNAKKAARLLDIARVVVPLPASNERLVQVNGATQVAAGTTLGLGIYPRLSALTLAGSLIPTTVAGHPFWSIDDPARRGAEQMQAAKNLALLGGLLAIASDGKR